MTGYAHGKRSMRWTVEWPTLGLIAACYGLWFVAGFYLYPASPLAALALLSVAIALHSSLQHEVLHGHPTRNRTVNELLVVLPLGLFFPYRRYKSLHLQHHADERLTDPYDDPESYYRALGDWDRMPAFLKTLLAWNNTFLGRLIIGPALTVVGFSVSEAKQVVHDRKIRTAWIMHALGLAGVVLLVEVLFDIPIWLYAATSAYGGLSILAIRSYCEHQWSESPDGRTVIVESTPLSLLFLNNNLHLVHHKMPFAPWYKLPELYDARREEWQAMNRGYVFRNYREIFAAFAFKAKEPVVHPVLHRSGRSASALPPHRHGVLLQGSAAVPIPASPPTE